MFWWSLIILLWTLFACSSDSISFVDDGNGHKQYKDSSGKYIKNDWAEIEGKYYYFDMNGYLVTNQWVQDEYYVDENGEMVTSRELKVGNDIYIFDSNGQSQMKARKVNKNVNWIIKNPFAKSYYTTTIHNDNNTKDESKKIKSKFNGGEQDVSIYVDAGSIEFKIYLFGSEQIEPMGFKDYEATLVTENGEIMKIWYWSTYGSELSWE